MFENTMKCAVVLLAIGCLLAISATAGATITQTKDSAAFDWKYEMDFLPDDVGNVDLDTNGAPDFDLYQSGSGSASVFNGILTIANGLKSLNYACPDGDELWPLDADITYANGYTFEVKLKIVSSVTNGFAWIACPGSGDPAAWLSVAAAGQSWKNTAESLGSGEDNTDAYHIFRVAQEAGATTFSVWRDGALLSDTLGSGYDAATDYLCWGDVGHDWGGEVEIDYLRFIHGAWAPGDMPPPIPGDANYDDVVDDKDASLLAANWQYGPDATWGQGDFNEDGIVNDEDASIMAAHWLESREGTAVPEPGCIVLLLCGTVSLLFFARRRS